MNKINTYFHGWGKIYFNWSIKMDVIEIIGYQTAEGNYEKMPLFTMSVSAGIPVPTDNRIEKEIDLNEFLVEHPAATFFARVNGDSLSHYGIRNGDMMIVDTSVEPSDGKVVLAAMNGELTVKIYRVVAGDVYLEAQNNRFLPLKIEPYVEYNILGTVTKIIHSF